MKLQLEKALSLVAVSVIGVLGSAQAAPVYEIKNIQDYDLKGNLEGTRNGYAMGVNSANEMVGISMGRKKLSTEDVEGGLIDPDDGIADEEKITYSILTPIVANNFPFSSAANGAEGAWLPKFESVNGTTNPSVAEPVNSVDSYFYGISEDGTKVGAMTAPEKKLPYVGEITDQKFWFYRDYELRAVVKKADGKEIPLKPPYEEYTSTKEGETNKKVYLGGSSSASAIHGNMVVGYASTDISKFGAERAQACLDSVGKDKALPLDICIQQEQYPSASGGRNIQYQTRAYVWQLGDKVTGTALPLGLTPPSDSNFTYVSQALGLNAEGTVVGRSHVNRYGNTDYFRMDAAYWTRKEDGSYQYNWVPVVNADDVQSSIAHSINDKGILVGSYRSYIGGYPRDKFFYLDTKATTPSVVVPNDFYPVASDLSSRPRDINNRDQVVGYIDTTHDKEKPRPKAGFLFDKNAKEGGEFSNLNNLLTCESKGFEKASDGKWQRHKVEVVDATGKILTYNSDIQIVEANSINDDGVIVGTAFIRKPVYKLDDKGKPIVQNGKYLFELDGNGNPVTSYLPRAVVLEPSKTATACTAVDADTGGEKYERQGAATLMGLLLLPLVWLRRRVKSA